MLGCPYAVTPYGSPVSTAAQSTPTQRVPTTVLSTQCPHTSKHTTQLLLHEDPKLICGGRTWENGGYDDLWSADNVFILEFALVLMVRKRAELCTCDVCTFWVYVCTLIEMYLT